MCSARKKTDRHEAKQNLHKAEKRKTLPHCLMKCEAFPHCVSFGTINF